MPSWPASSTLSRSSLTTTVPGPGLKRPLDVSLALDMWFIWAPVSDDPTASVRKMLGSCSSSRSLMVGVSGAPPLPTLSSDDVS